MNISPKVLDNLYKTAAQSISPAVTKLHTGIRTDRLAPLRQDTLQISKAALEKAAASSAVLQKSAVPGTSDVSALLAKHPVLQKFYASLEGFLPERLTTEKVMADLADESFMKGLSIDYSSGVLKEGAEEVQNLAAVISKRNGYLQAHSVEQFKSATSGTDVKYFDRTKGIKSTFDKLNSKMKSGVNIASFDDANLLIADGIGTRAVFKSLTADEALVSLKRCGIKDSEIATLKALWSKNTTEGLDEASITLLRKANAALAEAQTQKFVDRISEALQNSEITMSEIHNYAGKDGIAYFSDEQIGQIYSAWQKSDYAKAGGSFMLVSDIDPTSKTAHSLGFDKEYLEKIAKKSKKPSGYTACQANFEYASGALGEGQFRGAEVQKFAEYEHFPYDIKKDKTTVSEKIWKFNSEGKLAAAEELEEYKNLIRRISKDDDIYSKYNDYLSDVYNYLRKKELGILDITGVKIEMPKLNIEELTAHENELLSKECLEKISQGEFYSFVHPKP